MKPSVGMKPSIVWMSILLVTVILLLDQALKIWVKTNMSLGEDISLIGTWARIHFVENPGMAFGWMFGGKAGKLFLSVFRIIAIAAIIWYLRMLVRDNAPKGFVLCISSVLAGAMGNMIDCAFYGWIFDTGTVYNTEIGEYMGYAGVSALSCGGYAPFLQGCVVDMLSFPILHGVFPEWLPLVGNSSFLFFAPVFNISDSAVTVGGLSIIVFYWKYLKQTGKKPQQPRIKAK
ncbi:MAG: lipoprotein signal peptidase [Bacteroidales bacterium]|nr:lipoprotein signal peptidase [Bacteroidales bacterium]